MSSPEICLKAFFFSSSGEWLLLARLTFLLPSFCAFYIWSLHHTSALILYKMKHREVLFEVLLCVRCCGQEVGAGGWSVKAFGLVE